VHFRRAGEMAVALGERVAEGSLAEALAAVAAVASLAEVEVVEGRGEATVAKVAREEWGR